MRFLFWCILPLIGFPATMVTIVLLVHGIYPFFLHTRTISKLGILEKFFVTPSHHRVHHATNEQYLDKNYGSIFIIWDKMFGTFKEETEEPKYGLTKQLKSHSFLWQHLHFYMEMWEAIKSTSTFYEKVRIIVGKPETIRIDLRDKLESRLLPDKSIGRKTPGRKAQLYLYIQLFLTVVIIFLIAFMFNNISFLLKLLSSLFIIVTLIQICAVLEKRLWIFFMEYLRLVIITLATICIGNKQLIVASIIILLITTFFYHSISRIFTRAIYGTFFLTSKPEGKVLF